ncbi:MAG: prolyl oligopeptidase [Acidobacteriota bacterium]|jgi:prolyl oligopeptidase
MSDVVDTHHGVPVPDPYRWLENAESTETRAWVAAQNVLTRSFLDGPVRDELVARLTTLYDYPRTGVPFKRGGRYFFTHNTGLQDQPILYVQDGVDAAPRVLIDPNVIEAAGPVALTAMAPDESGALLAYARSESGSDRQDLFVRSVQDGRDLPDHLRWVKFVSIAWVGSGDGFFYTRFPAPGTVAPGDENYFNRVYYHRLGDDQDQDPLIFDKPAEREAVFGVEVSDDDRWVVITAYQGSSDKSEVYLVDRLGDSRPIPLFTGYSAAYSFIESAAARLLFRTDDTAPLGRIISIDPLDASAPILEVVAEREDKLSASIVVNKTIVASYLHDASDRILLFDLTGTPAGSIDLPAIGSVTGLTGRPPDDELFVGFTSFTYAPASFRYDFTDRVLAPSPVGLTTAAGGRARIVAADYQITQAWYPSRDGTRVSMFLVHRADLPRDGNRPVLLTGYGGFNISLTPAFDPANFVLLDEGGVYALANLRGGGEYGEAWHDAGTFERKQNVFDDFIGAAEWLVKAGYSRPERIAIEGGSNGGLLTAAVMVQRPELFGAVVCRVPVVDMLRYHLFTVGRFWVSEYGSADDPKQFAYLYQYSPLHRVRDGVAYPAILITTADTDDRVSPGMAKKFAARLQAADADDTPVLIRIETKAGHGAGKPVSKMIDEDADIFTFIFKYLKVR